MLVFPEYGLFPPSSRKKLKMFLENVPDPDVTPSNPCQEPATYADKPILYTLSCLALENNMIIIANMGDIQSCKGEKDCPKDEVFQYNTNVAFGRDGDILKKYHKEHLFGEFGMDVPKFQQDPTFQTDLGRFAMYVCFDIVFQRITEVAHWKGVKAVFLPTMWMNSSPMFAATQYFESWAIGNNVTLLAANVHLPGESGLGSGVMKGRDGAQVYTFNPDGHSKLLITDLSKSGRHSSIYIVTKNGTKEWTDDGKDLASECSKKILGPVKNVYKDYRCLERDTTNFTLTKLTKSSDYIESCNNGMCCTLNYSVKELTEDYYLGVYNGSFNAMNRYFFPEENCVLARCDGFGCKSCVTFPVRSKTVFYKVFMSANFTTTFVYPTVVETGMRQTPTTEWKFDSGTKTASISFESSPGKDLLMVGLKARPYQRDPPYVR